MSKVRDIVIDDLREKALKEVKELIQLAKDGKKDELISRLSKRDYIKDPDNEEDLALYTVATDPEEADEQLKDEFAEYFLTIEEECGKMKKNFIGFQQSEDEPIGQAFNITIPGKKFEDAEACTHYTVSFRLSLDYKLLVTEWYYSYGNYDCQED